MHYLYIYAAVLLFVLALYLRRHRRIARKHTTVLQRSIRDGLIEPASLHPVVNPVRCIGSGACVQACPEHALGIVDGKAVLTDPSVCLGHGACSAACPLEAITLVFGTQRRGVDIPNLSPDFESNVRGIFIAGELGGMGLIRKAAEQGRQAVDAIRKRANGSCDLDLLIVGSGPAGLSAGLSAIEHQLRYKIVEQEGFLGGTVFHYPRNKIAMTAPVTLPLVGKVRFDNVRKEAMLDFWSDVVSKTGLEVSYRERLEGVETHGNGFVVQTDRGRYSARSVLLAMGRRGTPRKLGVPGEETSKVVYRLLDPEQYAGQAVLVVGGGDSALEAAIALSDQEGTEVILSYRGSAFSRAKPKNREAVTARASAGRIQVLLDSSVLAIEPDGVRIEHGGTATRYPNQAVIVCAGGELPTPLLQKIGIDYDTKFGTA